MKRTLCFLLIALPLSAHRLCASTITITAYVPTATGGEVDTSQTLNPAKATDTLSSSKAVTGLWDYGSYSVHAGFGNLGLSYNYGASCPQISSCNVIGSGGRITANTVDSFIVSSAYAKDFISIQVAVDGSVNATGKAPPGHGAYDAEAYYLLQSAGAIDYQATASCSSSLNSPTCASGTGDYKTILLPFTSGDRDTLFATFSQTLVGTFGCSVGSGYDCSVSGDFGHTARIGGATIVDANGNPVQGATLSSVSGYDYTQPLAVNPVPEPSSICLLAIGMATGPVRHFHRKRTTRRSRPLNA